MQEAWVLIPGNLTVPRALLGVTSYEIKAKQLDIEIFLIAYFWVQQEYVYIQDLKVLT